MKRKSFLLFGTLALLLILYYGYSEYKIALSEKYSKISQSIAEMDDEALYSQMYNYKTSKYIPEKISTEIDNYVINETTILLDTLDYDAYLFLDRMIEAVSQDESLKNVREDLIELNKSYELNRTKSFLSGKWIKIDNWQNTGLRIKIIMDEDITSGIILDDLESTHPDNSRAVFKWDRGVSEFKDIQIIDYDTVALDHLDLYVYYNLNVQAVRYEPAIAKLDYENNRLILQSSESSDNREWMPNTTGEIYLREDAFVESSAITNEDFVVSLLEDCEQYEGDALDLNNWFSKKNNCFCIYKDNNIAKTSREIGVGSTYNEVISAYGYGKGNHFVEDIDPIFEKLKKDKTKDSDGNDLCTVLSEQADEYVRYQLGDSEQYIRIYFKDKVVSWICLYMSN